MKYLDKTTTTTLVFVCVCVHTVRHKKEQQTRVQRQLTTEALFMSLCSVQELAHSTALFFHRSRLEPVFIELYLVQAVTQRQIPLRPLVSSWSPDVGHTGQRPVRLK